MKKVIHVLCLICILILSGCNSQKVDTEKLKDLEFHVLEEEKLPQELKETIDLKKSKEFKVTYVDGDKLYIIRGYGKQDTGGYSIGINECYLTKDAIYLSTNLIGPDRTTEIPQDPSYPYVILQLDYIDKNVIFD
ncbi:MAG TPA: protease complex subunit PrcB family protein [Candidatus Merdenecus merdavium]|nr:protease complex subunit PrcB family protein [Candidatus Merdenecus merdavium]